MNVGEEIVDELAALGASRLDVFDVHSHTGRDVDGSERSAAEHVRDLDPLGGRSAIFPLCVEGGYASENRRVIAEAERHPRLVAFARLDPRREGGAEAEAALAVGARGIKLHPRGESFRLGHPAVGGIFAAAAAAQAPVLIHAGAGVGSLGGAIVDLASEHRRAPMILAHAGISDLAWLWPLLPEHPNIYFDTAWWSPADLLALFALVPPGRILFGSDAPYMGLALGLATTLRCARNAGLGADAVELVAGRQLEALLSSAEPLDGGPAPGPRPDLATVEGRRVTAMLTAAGGALIAGGDPAGILELAACAVETGGDLNLDPRLPELIALASSCGEEAVPALVMALCLAATPAVEAAAVPA